MSQRLVVLLILMSGLLSAQAEARCRRPSPDVEAGAEFSAPRPGDVEVYPLAPEQPPKPIGAAPVAAVAGNGRSARQTPDLANGTGGSASADGDNGGGNPAGPTGYQPSAPNAKLAAAGYAPKASEPVRLSMDASASYAVSAGETLRSALARWTSGSGWELVWDAPNDYSLSAAAEFHGGLTEAVTQLMESLRANGAPFGADIWQGNQVIRVTRNR